MLLKDICTIKSAKRIFENEYVDEGIPFVRGLEVSNHSLLKENTHFECYISKKRYNEIKEKYGVPQIGDILITAVGTIGNLCFINKEFEFYYKDGNLIQFTNFKDCVNSHFLYYFMHSPIFKKSLEHSLIGAVQKALTMDMLGKIEIDLPDRKTQDKIAEILSGIDEQINHNNEVVKKLQVLGNTIYSKIMCQPKTKILLGDIATMYQPETITSDKFVDNGQYPVYGAGGIIGFYDRCNHKDSELMLSCRGVCGKTEISLPNSFIIGNQMVIKTKDEDMKYFLYNYLSNSDLSKIETGSVQKQITRTNLEKMPIMLPPTEIIHQHYGALRNIYDMKTKIIIENTKLNALKENLLPILINGQLSI